MMAFHKIVVKRKSKPGNGIENDRNGGRGAGGGISDQEAGGKEKVVSEEMVCEQRHEGEHFR